MKLTFFHGFRRTICFLGDRVASPAKRLPVVLTREEAKGLLAPLESLLYGCG